MRLRSTTFGGIFVALTTLTPATPGHAETAARAAPAPQRSAVVLGGGGEVRPAFDAPWRAIREGATLPSRAEVRATEEPLRIQLKHGGTIELAPGASAAIVGQLEIDLPRIGKINAARIDLTRGEIAVTAPHAESPRDRTPVLVQGDGGLVVLCLDGAMLVREQGNRRGDPQSGLAIAASEGEVQFASRGGFHALPEGQVVDLHAGRRTALPRPIVGRTEWHREVGFESSGPLAVVSDRDGTAALTLRFEPTDGAKSYDVEVASDDAFSSLVLRQSVPAKSTTITTPPLAPGRYFARIRARGPSGLPGIHSRVRPLRVAYLAVPPGGVVETGGFELPRNRTLTWDDPGGLEVSRGRSGFIQAAAELGLARNEPTLAQVRILGERGVVPLMLRPSTLRAEIEMSPKRAVWPKDPVEIAVRLVDTRYQPNGSKPPTVEPKLRVVVNLREIPVTWRREGSLYRATVERPTFGPGPWVVRVEASDPDDNPIGRDFLEVIAQK